MRTKATLGATTFAAALLAGATLVGAPAMAQYQGSPYQGPGDRSGQYGYGWSGRSIDERARSEYERGFRLGREDERRSRFGAGQHGGQWSGSDRFQDMQRGGRYGWDRGQQSGSGGRFDGPQRGGWGGQSQSYGGPGGMGSQRFGGWGGEGGTGGGMRDGQGFDAQRMGDRLGEERIRERLRERGYSDIENLERRDGRFTADAMRYGERVEDLRIDPRTGMVLNQSRLNEDQVKAMLSDRGWSNVRGIDRDGNVIEATARRDGRDFDLRMNARTGDILYRERRDSGSGGDNGSEG